MILIHYKPKGKLKHRFCKAGIQLPCDMAASGMQIPMGVSWYYWTMEGPQMHSSCLFAKWTGAVSTSGAVSRCN